MSAAGRNLFKTVIGLAVGAGIGALFAKEIGPLTGQEPESTYGIAGTPKPEPKESLKERWERSLSAGEAAQEAKEAELRSYFRHKVEDPTAFTIDRTNRHLN